MVHSLTQHQRGQAGQQAACAHPPSGELHRARIFQGRPRELAVEVEIRVRELRIVPLNQLQRWHAKGLQSRASCTAVSAS